VFTAYRYKNVAIAFWFNAATPESLVHFERAAQATCELLPEGLSLVNIMVPGGRSMPSAEVRKKLGQIAHEHAKSTAAVGVMIPGSGFWASALRGLVTAVSMLMPRSYKLEICSSLREVAEWLAPVHSAGTGAAIDAPELLRALHAAEAIVLSSGVSLQPPAR